MRRTKLEREGHRRLIEEGLVLGLPPGQIVRGLARSLGLTLRQARRDLEQVQEAWRIEDDDLRANRRLLVDLAIAADRCDREFRAALEAKDARRALRAEKHRCKLLGLYAADRRRERHVPGVERKAIIHAISSDLKQMYAEAPRHPDGSVVLTAHSRTPPPDDDESYRRGIQQPLAGGPSPRRQERLDELRAALAGGARLDQLESLARQRYGVSSRQIRGDVRLLERQLADDGYMLHQGTHPSQHLSLAERRRERLKELALRPVARPEQGCEERVAVGWDKAAPAAAGPPEAGTISATSCGALRKVGDSLCESKRRAGRVTHAKKPDYRLAGDVESDRCRLLGLHARERPKSADDDLRWTPPDVSHIRPRDDEVGRIDNLSYASRRPPGGPEREHYDLDRMTEQEFARFDARRGFRHTVEEMLPGRWNADGNRDRTPWQPPLETSGGWG